MTGQTPRLGWGHVNINVRDLDRAIAFYEKLGFEVFMPAIPYLALQRRSRATVPDLCAGALGLARGTRGRACIMQLGEGYPKLDLTEFDTAGAGAAPSTSAGLGLVRLCLASRDLAHDHAHLAELGVEFLTPPQAAAGGLADIAVCVDPDGTQIELIQIHPAAWRPLGSAADPAT